MVGAAPAAVVTDTRLNPVLSLPGSRAATPAGLAGPTPGRRGCRGRGTGLPAQGVPEVRPAARRRGGTRLVDQHSRELLPRPCAYQGPAIEIDSDQVERFSLFRKIADEDPFPYSDPLHLDFLAEFSR
jgi:hypothetical protein